MARKREYYTWLILFLAPLLQCRKEYSPPVIKQSNHFLAIDGLIAVGTGITSTFTLTRSVNLGDTIPFTPELNAQVAIQGSNSTTYPLIDSNHNGVYISSPLTLDVNQQYQLAVTTSDGHQYLSDLVSPKTAPSIDSVTWELSNNAIIDSQVVSVFVNAHDPQNNTHYYRWDYLETYQHRSYYISDWGVNNGLIFPLDPSAKYYNCWSNGRSTDIVVGSTVALSQDVVSHQLLTTFAQNDARLDVEYSMLVRQYALSLDAYNFWLTVQKNSQSLGGLFDLQPSQVTGNIHALTNSTEPVLGYVGASSVTEKRIFISHFDIPSWRSNSLQSCDIKTISAVAGNELQFNYSDTSYGVYHFISEFPPAVDSIALAPNSCLNCTYQGGTITKPAYWP